MKEYLKKDYIVYIAVKTASFIICLLPLKIALWIGKVIGIFMYHFHPKRKRIAYANLKATFSKDKTPSELKNILKRTYKNYGQTIIETLKIPKIDYNYLKKYVKFDKPERIPEALSRGKGAIYLCSHFGNWELSSLKSAQIGYPIYVLVRPQKYERLDNLLNSFREKFGCQVIKRGMPTRKIIMALKENKILGILSDQDVGKEGTFINLLGRPASHAVGAIRLARDTGATIIPTFMIRQKGPRHLIKFEDLIIIPKTDDRDAEIKKGLEKHARILESYVRQYPDQWMWVYTRWKSTPLRKVVILNDGKTGHLNQSKAALEVIKRCRRDTGYKDEDTSFEVIDVKFKNHLTKSLLFLCALSVSDACQGCMRCLKFSLTKDCYDKIIRSYADIVISCGSSLSAVNIFISKENNSKNVVIMKPGIQPLRNFDVAIIPKHDRPKKRDNVVITQGAPNLVSEETMKDGGDKIRSLIPFTQKKLLGLLIGGDNPEYIFTADLASRLISQIEKVLQELDMELLVTTSRRTPKPVEDLLKKRLGPNPRCKFLLIPNEKNMVNAVSGILDLSEVILVSGESISMVSEAASSGKWTLVFDLLKKKRSPKHEYAIKRLDELNYIIRIPVDRICDAVTRLSQTRGPAKRLNDTQKMYEKLYRII